MTNRYPVQDFDVAAAQAQLSDIMQTDNPEDDGNSWLEVIDFAHKLKGYRIVFRVICFHDCAELRFGIGQLFSR